ncbi:hypothetical protein ACNQF7_10295 [Flavobacterium sp. RSP29]|uniref:hypothetical protein n=1 Tax=Flavobacterium sp. RSP29 TaxID=3401731 RepID=UPI003AAB4EB4
MAIKKYTIEVTRVDEYEIEIDDSIWTDERISSWSDSFFETDEDSRQEDFVKLLANALTHQDIKEGMEGFGYVKQKYHSMEEGDLLTQYSSGLTKVSEENYTEGLFVNIISHKDEYDTEIFTTDLTLNK